MKDIKLLKLILTKSIHPKEIVLFRSAIIDSFERRASLYDNHTQDGKDIYRYPLVQYKRHFDKALILFIDEGVNAFLREPLSFPKDLRLGERKVHMDILSLQVNEFTLHIDREHPKRYRIHNWMALNQKNNQVYNSLSALDRVALLQKLLSNHIISFIKGVSWHRDQRFNVKLVDIPIEKNVYIKDGYKKVFSFTFVTDIQLPHFIGLGKSPSIGFGTITPHRE